MLKRRIIKRILITTGALFACILVYLIPSPQTMNASSKYSALVKKEYIYLLDDHNMLGRTSVIINSEDLIDKANELLDVLIIGGKGESVIPSGFRSIIPSETVVNGISFDDGVMQVDFNNSILDVNKDLEQSMIEAITYTLTSLKDIIGVVITVNGTNLEQLPNSGYVLPILLTRDFGINKKYDIVSLNNINKVVEYYVSKHNDNYYYVPVTKYVNDDRDKIKIIIEDLTSSNIYMNNLISFINNNTRLLKTNIDGNIMELTFNNYILSDFNSSNILEEVIDTISLSIKDNYNVDEVIFYVQDKEIYKSVLKTIE